MISAYLKLIRERGIKWFTFRSLYVVKLKTLNPATERLYEKRIPAVQRIDLFDIDTDALKAFLKKLPQPKQDEILYAADEAGEGRIKAFSCHTLDYGHPVDWQLNPMTGQRCNEKAKWYAIPDFDSSRGDVKVIWEASRFSQFIRFARAYLLSGNIRYYQAFSDQLAHWLRQNPYSYGANFKCGQECAIRMIVTLLAGAAFKDQLSDADKANINELVARCYRKILSNYFYAAKCQRNNHALSETLGMIAGAWCCGDSKRLDKAYRLLDAAILDQFTEDGGYMQQSFNYQRVALQDIEAVLSISGKTGHTICEAARARVLASIQLMYQCQDESGRMPNFGSNDGALTFPLTVCGYQDYRPVLNTVYALLKQTKLYSEDDHEEELLWFGADNAVPVETVLRVSSQFKQAGLFTLRKERFWLMLIAKPTTAHMDQNHIDLWINGRNVLCDCGTYSYAGELGRSLASTQAHNTAYCAGKEQVQRIGAFAVYGQPSVRKLSWSPERIHSGIVYQSGYIHSRTVSVLEDGIIIEDKLEGAEGEIRFHTPCAIHQTEDGFRLDDVCTIHFEASPAVSEAKRSLYYLQTEDISCLSSTGNKTEIRISKENAK